MKITYFLLTLFLLAGFFSHSVEAATEEWDYDCGSNMVYQVYADGKGGAAMIYGYTTTNLNLVWFDKKGEIIYQTALSNLMVLGIAGCTSKDLVYCDVYPDTGIHVFHVNSKGEKDNLLAAPGTFNTTMTIAPSYNNKSHDKKGFFASFTETNTFNSVFKRYRNK